jgi:hypothetical protein
MGYSFGVLDQARALITSLRPDTSGDDLWAWGLPEGPAELRREVQQVSAEAGRVVARFVRLLFVLLSTPTFGLPSSPAEEPQPATATQPKG